MLSVFTETLEFITSFIFIYFKQLWLVSKPVSAAYYSISVLLSVQMSAVGITENVKGDNKKFEVWYNGREEVYIIQVCFYYSNDTIFPSLLSLISLKLLFYQGSKHRWHWNPLWIIILFNRKCLDLRNIKTYRHQSMQICSKS